jgi:hypothetical protein
LFGRREILTQRRNDAKMKENEIGKVVVDAAVEEHRELGLDFKPSQAVQRMRLRRAAHLFVLLIAGIVGLVGFVMVLMLVSTPSGPVTVSLQSYMKQSYTNAYAVITIKNRASDFFDYTAMVQRKIGEEWPEWRETLALGISDPIQDAQSGTLGPSQQTNLTLNAYVYAPPYPWRIAVVCRRDLSKVKSVRYRLGIFCVKLGWFNASHKLLGEESIQIATPEMAQWEK